MSQFDFQVITLDEGSKNSKLKELRKSHPAKYELVVEQDGFIRRYSSLKRLPIPHEVIIEFMNRMLGNTSWSFIFEYEGSPCCINRLESGQIDIYFKNLFDIEQSVKYLEPEYVYNQNLETTQISSKKIEQALNFNEAPTLKYVNTIPITVSTGVLALAITLGVAFYEDEPPPVQIVVDPLADYRQAMLSAVHPDILDSIETLGSYALSLPLGWSFTEIELNGTQIDIHLKRNEGGQLKTIDTFRRMYGLENILQYDMNGGLMSIHEPKKQSQWRDVVVLDRYSSVFDKLIALGWSIHPNLPEKHQNMTRFFWEIKKRVTLKEIQYLKNIIKNYPFVLKTIFLKKSQNSLFDAEITLEFYGVSNGKKN